MRHSRMELLLLGEKDEFQRRTEVRSISKRLSDVQVSKSLKNLYNILILNEKIV